jgi:hypothetical protein
MDQETKWLRAINLPVNRCNSLVLRGGCISIIARIFLGLTSIPLYETIKPRNLLEDSPNVHLAWFNFT